VSLGFAPGAKIHRVECDAENVSRNKTKLCGPKTNHADDFAIDQWLEHLAPFRKDYKHHETGEDNGDSHLKALLINHEVIVPITAGKLDLGTWQRIFYAEFDGQRDKRVIVKVMGE